MLTRTHSDQPYIFDGSLLREYDVRGKVGSSLSAQDAYALGRAFGSVAVRRGVSSIAVGFDGRHSSPALAAALAEGLIACGLQVLNIGCCPTPMLYFATHTLEVGGGVMVTGSHNPPDYNGFKLTLGGNPFFGEDIQALGRTAAEADYVAGNGETREVPVFDTYVDRLLQDVGETRPLRVAWDAGNGASGEVMRALTSRLPGRHFLLNEEIDGAFPSHHPDPTVPENLEQLQETVLEERCDLGIAFDGDGDRLGIVDSKARILRGDQILLFLARDILQRHPSAPVIADVKCSQVLFDGIAEAGGKPVMWKTGHSLIKKRMKELGAPIAGEMSGHLFIADGYYGYDDALYAAIRVLLRLQASDQDLAGFRDSLTPVSNTPEIRIPCPEERKAEVIAGVRNRLVSIGAEFDDIDGVRVRQAYGWWLLRPSNTEEILVVRCEGVDSSDLERLINEVAQIVFEQGVKFPSCRAAMPEFLAPEKDGAAQ